VQRAHTACGLIEVHIDALQLQVGLAVVCTSRVNAMLIADNFPEFGANLVAALAALDVDDLTHG
jgi:hypothetical protein